MSLQNLFADLPPTLAEELFTELPVEAPGLKLERIVSHGQASPPGYWYDQPWHEWVLLLRGSAGLRFADDDHVHILNPGDYVNIPAHRRHRVEWTHPGVATVWLAIHYAPAEG